MTLDLLHAPDLSVFAPPLQRLILCGGNGLPAAYGPLGRYDGTVFIWNPMAEAALPADGLGADLHPLKIPACFVLPLDHWRARLALVAALLVIRHNQRNRPATDPLLISASVDVVHDHWEQGSVVALTRFAHRGPLPSSYAWKWSAATGRCWEEAVALPTLPAHLAQHDAYVATLLALFDVPEIRAQMEAL